MTEKVQLKEAQTTKIENQETRINLDNLKESIEIKQKVNLIKNSKLNKLDKEMFDEFIGYLEKRALKENSKDELNQIVLLLNNGFINDLIKYFDINNPKDGYGFFNDISSFEDFKEYFKEKLKKQNTISINTDINKTSVDVDKTSVDVDKTSVDVDKTSVDVDNRIETEKILYIKTKEILLKYKDKLNHIINGLDETKNIQVNIDYLKENQDEIFEVIKKEAKDTNNTEDLRKIANSFKSLGIIEDKKYKEIYDFADTLDNKKEELKPKSLSDTQKELAVGYTSRGDTLYKSTDKTSFTIEDGKITSVSKDSGFKLTDYSTLDEDGKKLTEKIKLEAEIKGLMSDLSENKDKKIVLDRIEAMINDVKIDNITDDNIKIAIVVIGSKFPLLNNQLLDIKNSSHNPKEKLEYIIRLIYGHITGNTNTFELNGLSLTEQIYITKNKLEIKDTEQNKKLQELNKKLEELKKLYPNLDEKSIQEKIKTQETKMQDTIKFCDEYGLSSLGHIAYIKQVIREFNKNEVDRKIPEDIGSGTEFLDAFKNDKDGKLTESLKKFIAKLLGKEVKDIFKDGNLGLNTIDRSTFDPDTGSAETINKDYLEKLLKDKGVLKKNSGELNIYKVQELLDE